MISFHWKSSHKMLANQFAEPIKITLSSRSNSYITLSYGTAYWDLHSIYYWLYRAGGMFQGLLLIVMLQINLFHTKLECLLTCCYLLAFRVVYRVPHVTSRDHVVERTLVWRAHGVRYVAWFPCGVNEQLLCPRTQRFPALAVAVAVTYIHTSILIERYWCKRFRKLLNKISLINCRGIQYYV